MPAGWRSFGIDPQSRGATVHFRYDAFFRIENGNYLFHATRCLELVGTGLKIVSWADNAVWLGLSDRRIHDAFEWIDGTILDYTDWGPAEPKSSSGPLFSVYYADHFSEATNQYTFKWDAATASNKVRASACKKDPWK